MDYLATLAVEAVERPEGAVQAYGLLCTAQPYAPYAQNLPDGVCPVPAWAAPYTLEALQRVPQLATLLAQLATLTEPPGYQFDPRQVPRLVSRSAGDS